MVRWSRRRGHDLVHEFPKELEESAARLKKFAARGMPAGRPGWLEETTLAFENGDWQPGCPASKFPLLHESLENASIHLMSAWGSLGL